MEYHSEGSNLQEDKKILRQINLGYGSKWFRSTAWCEIGLSLVVLQFEKFHSGSQTQFGNELRNSFFRLKILIT
jgi:hypothetical protein